jgi:hypothetical protein
MCLGRESSGLEGAVGGSFPQPQSFARKVYDFRSFGNFFHSTVRAGRSRKKCVRLFSALHAETVAAALFPLPHPDLSEELGRIFIKTFIHEL